MRKIVAIVLLFCMIPQLLSADIIVTKDKNRYSGKVVKILPKDFAIKLDDGTIIIIPKNKVSQIIRNNIILDIDQGIRYSIEKRRPFLPFLIPGTVAGVYAFKKFNDYKHNREKNEGSDEIRDLKQSKTDLALGIVSTIFSVGSFYIALKPVEIKVPMGKINLSATPRGVNLALHF